MSHPHVTVVNSGGTLVNAVLLAQPCIVHAFHVLHSSGNAGYIQIHDSATVPAEGAVPQQVHTVAANTDAVIENFPPITYLNGVYVCESDTIATKTLTTPTDLFVFMIIEEKTWDDQGDL